MARAATKERKTTETRISVRIDLDGMGTSTCNTGIPFLNHMLTLFSRHGFFDLTVEADGDLEVDQHHTMEDIGIVLGQAIREALGDKSGIQRYGFFVVPMDDALARVVLDLSGRPYLEYKVECPVSHISGIDVRLFHEFFQALTVHLGVNLHIDLLRGQETHHILEAVFKAFARALNKAVALHSRETGIPSTKGSLD